MKRIAITALLLSIDAFAADTISLKSGQTVSGILGGWNGGYVTLAIEQNIERRFRPGEIDLIELDPTEAPDRLATYLGLISPAAEAALLDTLIASPAEAALEKAKLWQPKFIHRDHADQALLFQMETARSLQRLDESANYARRWIGDKKASSSSALPWLILAEISASEGRRSEALWTCLQPIAFRGLNDPPYLDRCYELALTLSKTLNLNRYSAILDAEAQGLSPPALEDAPHPATRLPNLNRLLGHP